MNFFILLLCHSLQVAPYNTYYSQLEDHLSQVGIDTTLNRWDEPIALGMVDPHDSLSHPVGVSDVQTESASRIDPDQFSNFLVRLELVFHFVKLIIFLIGLIFRLSR